MDQSSLNIWLGKSWSLTCLTTKSLLVIGPIFTAKQESFVNSMRLAGTFAEFIDDWYICTLQPCDVGVMKSFKCGIRRNTWHWHGQNIFTWTEVLNFLFQLANMYSRGYSTCGTAFLNFVFKKHFELIGLAHYGSKGIHWHLWYIVVDAAVINT